MTTQVILNPNGSGGDVYPFLAIGQQLQKLGHHVALMTNPMFQEYAGQANLEFIPLGRAEDLISVGRDPQLQKQSSAWKLALKWVVRTVPEGVAYLSQRRLRCPTMLVGSPLSLSMRLVAEKYSIPMTTLILSPYMLRSQHASSRMPPLCLNRFVPGSIKRMQFWLADRCAIDPILAPTLNPIRKELGLRPLNRFLHQWCFSPELNLGLFPEWFAASQPDWPTPFQHVGSVHWDPKSDPQQTEQILRWCDRQICPPLVVLAGSAGPPGNDFYSIWSQAASRIGRGLIVLEPDRTKLPKELPEQIVHANYLSLDLILPKVAAVIHSGSIGAVLRCANAGVPQLIFPRVNDQFDNADRVVRLGIGHQLNTGELKALSPDLATLVLSKLLQDRQIESANQRLKQTFSRSASIQCPNVRLAAELIHKAFRLPNLQT